MPPSFFRPQFSVAVSILWWGRGGIGPWSVYSGLTFGIVVVLVLCTSVSLLIFSSYLHGWPLSVEWPIVV